MKKQLSERQQHELDKYLDVFDRGTTGTPGVYAHKNWGSGIYDHIIEANPNSILDVGCGMGVFVNEMDKIMKIPKVYGLDIASVKTNTYHKNDNITWIDALAHDIPLADGSVEYITSFDCLEHCLPEDVDTIVDEFYRVCTKGLFLSIAYHQAHERTFDGEIMHMTVEQEQWWIDKFSRKFNLVEVYNTYLIFNK
tara:strand:- start:136 stop:720 length:585 start_codon:yes stop_codon:yes gene_type:complete